MATVGLVGCPEIDVDLWSDEELVDPYPTYARLRELGPVLYTPKWDAYVLTRYDEVRKVLQDWETFTSARGVGMSPTMNLRSGHGILTTDPPLHDTRRRVLNAQLVPREIERHRGFIADTAASMVADVVRRRSFDAVADLAAPFSVKIVADLVGLPAAGRDDLIERASAAFNTFGPDNELSFRSRPLLDELFHLVKHELTPDMLTADGWGRGIYEAGEHGAIEPEACPGLMLAYLWAGMDTTVNGIGTAISLFADHPDQWDLLRADPDLMASAVNEVLRIEPPVQRFTRATTRATAVAGVELPAGARVAVLFGSANRDERRFPEPDRFDITRNPTDHLSFGRGIHRCVGAGLAQDEMRAVLDRLAGRVARFTVTERVWRRNNALHGLERLVVEIEPVRRDG
jgi:cytochrome P450